ncbi:MAG TPA: extensin family protein [Allosphingosinicella sp.]|nr:extensin family protein [Allosphingosinicella sp.]
MRRARRILLLLLPLAALVLGVLAILDYARRYPQDVPWTALDLRQPVGAFTGRKLAGLADEPGRCRALLAAAGAAFTALPPRAEGAQCGYRDAVRFGAREISYRPADVGFSCPVAAALLVWEREVVQVAAQRHFGRRVTGIDHFGAYSCRRMYGRGEGAWSEHATANAFDVAAFRLADGTRVAIVNDWRDQGPKGRFLREVRDGACSLFGTVLSPDYNVAHRDHLHLDQASRGQWGWRACR